MKINRKVKIYILTVLILGTFLTSCAKNVGDTFSDLKNWFLSQIELIRNEYDGIMQFFDDTFVPSDEPAEAVLFAESDNLIPSTLVYVAHTEIIESVYNRAEDGLFIYNPGDPETVYERNTEPLTSAQRYGYTVVPRPDKNDFESVRNRFSSAGIKVSVEYRTNTAPAGDVFAVSYAGLSDNDAFYVNPDVDVKLYVSNHKKAVMETDPTKNNVVYLTYDDGPTLENTGAILDILDSYGVKASFFLTGDAIKKYPSSAQEIVVRGHGIGCHSVTHVYENIYSSTDALASEIVLWEEIVSSAGITLPHKIFRYPGGSVGKYLTDTSRAEMNEMLASKGYNIFDWNVVTNDSILYMRDEDESTYDYIKANFIETLEARLRETADKEGAPIIILMHETVDETVNLTGWLIEYLVNRGFTFGALHELDTSWTFRDGE